MKKFYVPHFRIDWPNHLIGFFSALFGILIAFELDSWRERKNQQELVQQAVERLKTEIRINQNSLHTTVRDNLERIQALRPLIESVNGNLLYRATGHEIDSINKLFTGTLFIEAPTDLHKQVLAPVHVSSFALAPVSLHTSAWESAKATGVVNFMEYEKVLLLSSVYNYTAIVDEQELIRALVRKADDISTQKQLLYFLSEVEETYRVIERELSSYDQFINMINVTD
jgi:hypothetical protein